MSKKTNPSIIGAFVVGGVAIAIIAVIVFGGGRFLKKTDTCVAFFQGSVKGLDVGSAVSFRGVNIGSVTDVIMLFDTKTKEVNIEVVLEIDRDRARSQTRVTNRQQMLQELINNGLRAQLNVSSILTGLLYVDLDFRPDKPAKLVGLDKQYPEIPTIPTNMQQIQNTVSDVIEQIRQLPLQEIVTNFHSTLQGINQLVNAPETMNTLRSLDKTMADTQQLISDVRQQLTTISASVDQTMQEVRTLAQTANGKVVEISSKVESVSDAAQSALTEAKKALSMKEGTVGNLANSILETSRQTNAALRQLEQTLASVSNMTSPDSQFYNQLDNTLKELSRAAEAIRGITDYLNRHPEALLRGKGPDGGK